MNIRHPIGVLCFGLALAACAGEGNSGAGGEAAGGAPAVVYTSCESAVDGAPRVVAAYLKRIERAHGDAGPALVAALLDPARAAVDTPEVEARRERHAGDHLVRGYLAPFVDIAGVPDADWLDQLPEGELTAEQVSEAGARALVLLDARRAALPLAEAPWVAVYDQIAAQRHEATHMGIPGVPAGWYGSDSVFRASWHGALVAGFTAGQQAWLAALESAPDDVEAATQAAIGAVLAANQVTFDEIIASSLAEAQALIAME